MDNKTIGRYIIDSNKFMSVATSHSNDTWIAPVFYATDENYNLYFVSHLRSKHAIHIILNTNVAVSIFDSTQEEGDGANGLQIKGVAYQISKSRYQEVISLFYEKNGIKATPDMIAGKIKEYGDKERVIFQIKPTEVYVQDREYFKEHRVDNRVQINLA